MLTVRLIQNERDGKSRPTRLSLQDGLNELRKALGVSELADCRLRAPSYPQLPTDSAYLSYIAEKLETLVAFPMSRGCRATTSSGVRRYLDIGELDNAVVDDEGNVDLADGTFVRAVEFDPVELKFELSRHEEAIVELTIRYLKADQRCVRRLINPQTSESVGCPIDYSTLFDLTVLNVDALCLYINRRIRVPSDRGKSSVSSQTVRRVLDLVGINGFKRSDTVSP